MVDIWVMSAAAERRERLVRSVAADPSIRVSGSAATFPYLRSLMAESSADVAVIDWQAQAGASVAREWLMELFDTVAVVLLCAEPDSSLFNRIRAANAGAMLQPDSSPAQLIQAIKSAAAGLVAFDSALLPQPSDEGSLIEPLTPRETEVLQLLADGLGNREIAVRLSVSEHTVKFHIRSIFGKFGASSRTEAVSRGLRSGLIDL